MMNRPGMLSPAAPPSSSRPRLDSGRNASWRIRRIRRSWFYPPPSMEEVEERLRSDRGFFASLTPEQRAAMEAYDGPEVLGDPNGPRRKY